MDPLTDSHSSPSYQARCKAKLCKFSIREKELQITAGGVGSSESSSETSATKASTKTCRSDDDTTRRSHNSSSQQKSSQHDGSSQHKYLFRSLPLPDPDSQQDCPPVQPDSPPCAAAAAPPSPPNAPRLSS